MPKIEVACAYSVLFQKGNDPHNVYAVDWNWSIPGQWSCSEKEIWGYRWDPSGPLDEQAHEALLKHFGLTEWKDEFPISRILRMHPRALAAERRKKEGEHDLPRLAMISDTVGDHIPAEDYP